MNPDTEEQSHYGFVTGLLAGACVGAGLAMWLVPRSVAELKGRMTDATRGAGRRASEVRVRAGEAVDELTRQGRGARDGVAQAVARGAREVERFATAAGEASKSAGT